MVNQSDWMRTFNQLITEKGSVKLYNTYRGLPLITDAAVLEIKEGKVITSIFGYQAVSMALAGRTHLYSPGFHEALRANVIEVDFKKKRAILSDFSRAGESVGKRRLVRVEPSETLEVQIYDGRQKIGGKLTDISTEGMCIITYFAYVYGLKFQYDKKVFIDFKPPYSDSMVRCMGIISNMSGQEGTYLHRLGLRTIPSPYIKPLLDDYINRRQKELMNEMERTYISMRRKKSKRG
jgi:hypothetical protein